MKNLFLQDFQPALAFMVIIPFLIGTAIFMEI